MSILRSVVHQIWAKREVLVASREPLDDCDVPVKAASPNLSRQKPSGTVFAADLLDHFKILALAGLGDGPEWRATIVEERADGCDGVQ